ncbi:hypothetical protein [Pseudaminobacter soli (ex Li et al. 2025)]|uniref:Aminoglycoside phosphotransferase domain-containing protein n=1 Tax=Pseudaminobacter soli (ex Li et al. 2025) TaxID=1295366 RepID=A0A2P7S2B4_9HYPH|nr:hypothetical protein [Mesorhizobium soli]PSJ56608.1 hypothetical protein C7I85_23880 [Mesorhizobium soli]
MTHLAEKVKFLSDPSSYGGATRRVEARETHMSWVFLTDSRVYKLKKPVRYPFLDFSSLPRRFYFCREELKLNSRLAENTYLAVVALRCDETGHMSLSGAGHIIDWLVEMRRLPASDMLDARIRHGSATRHEIERVGDRLVDFYARCPRELGAGETYVRYLAGEQLINRRILGRPELGLPGLGQSALDKVDHALEQLGPAIEERVRRGTIVEGHGDLRPEHICLTDPPQIIDCLEFNHTMRIVDPYDEVNYLGIECDVLGATWIRPLLRRMLERGIGNAPDAPLLALYGGFRALLRARLCVAHLLEHPVRHGEKWHPLAIRYVAAADAQCLNLPSPAGRRSNRAYGDV